MSEHIVIAREWRAVLKANGLEAFNDFFRLDGESVHCHESRDIVRVQIGRFRGYLKREFYIPTKEFIASWWAGCGWVSKSEREWTIICDLRRHGVGVATPVAVGRQEGRAFLLVEELNDAVALTHCLQNAPLRARETRGELARSLGRSVAQLHQLGFNHPDMYAKHVWLNQAGEPVFLDLQRSRRRVRTSWSARWRDLAALDASLSEEAASLRERLIFLRSYLRWVGERPMSRRFHQGLWAIARRSNHLLSRRRIRAMRAMAAPLRTEPVVAHYRLRPNNAGWELFATESHPRAEAS